mgnify:CR=1 FL=1
MGGRVSIVISIGWADLYAYSLRIKSKGASRAAGRINTNTSVIIGIESSGGALRHADSCGDIAIKFGI